MGKLINIATVGIFALLLYFIIDYITGQITEKVDIGSLAPTVKYYMCRFGVFEAVNIYVSLLIGSWFANKIIVYLSQA